MTSQADFTDQLRIFDPRAHAFQLTMIGIGGIGASALPTLVTLGLDEFVLWDPDRVEERNVASQLLFTPDDVGKRKVNVAKRYLMAYGAQQVVKHRRLFSREDRDTLDGIVISAVDSMAARREIWGAVKYNGLVPLFMDGRIGGELCVLCTIDPCDPDSVEWYEEFMLFDDAEAEPLPCAERAIVYPAVTLGAVMAAQITRFARGHELQRLFNGNLECLGFETVS